MAKAINQTLLPHPKVHQAYVRALYQKTQKFPKVRSTVDKDLRSRFSEEKAYTKGSIEGLMNQKTNTSAGAPEIAAYLTRTDGGKVARTCKVASLTAKREYEKNIKSLSR